MEKNRNNFQNQDPQKPRKERPIRIIESDTSDEEMMYGHIIEGADHPKNEHSRGGFGNRDGKEGYGTDSSNGPSATSVNEEADDAGSPPDNIASDDERSY